MKPNRLDTLSRLFAGRRASRRSILTGAAPVATPPAGPVTPKQMMLFVQTFQSGSIAPIAGVEGRYTLALEQGHGQTMYFSNRPDRIVGAAPTDRFLAGLGFLEDNPPNAALVVESAPGETDVAVVELFTPMYDPATRGITYEIEVLANWQAALEMEFGEAPTDLTVLESSFGAAQLFIDDCADADMQCVGQYSKTVVGVIENSMHDGFCYSWGSVMCLPCQPKITDSRLSNDYWTSWCNATYRGCYDLCVVKGFW